MRRRTKFHLPRSWNLILLLGFGLFLLAITAFATSARATPSYQGDGPSNDFCLACHQEQGIALNLGSESLPVTINPTLFGLSVHAEEGINCVDCHTNISDYPHPDGTFPNTVKMLQTREGLTEQDIDNLLGGTAAKFFGLKQYL